MLISCQYGDKMTLLNGSSLAGKRCVMFCFGTHLSLGSSDDEKVENYILGSLISEVPGLVSVVSVEMIRN